MKSVLGILDKHRAPDSESAQLLGPGAWSRSRGRATVIVNGPGASAASNDAWICAVSGRVDNYEDLNPGKGWSSDMSTAMSIGTLIARDGLDGLRSLRGIFAGVFSDGERMWSFRDHMGFWPMYHTTHGDRSVAADSIRVCVTASGRRYDVNESYLESFFYGRIGSSEDTAVTGVMRLPAATWLRVDSGGVDSNRFWDPRELIESDPPAEESIPSIFDELMTTALNRVLTGSDAVSLSGGVDSPVIAAFAAPLFRERFGRDLPAVSAVYPDIPSVDEEELIRLVADSLALPLHTYKPAASPTDDLSRWVTLLDGPVPVISLAETLETLEVARSLGVTNLLTGEWAEYLFDMPKRTLAYLIRMGRFGPARQYWSSLRTSGVRTSTILTRLAKDLTPYSARKSRALRVMAASTPAWLDHSRIDFHPRGPVKESWRNDQAMMLDGPGLGLEADHVVQREAGVDIRRPFADVDVVEFFLRLPAQVKYPGPGRKLLMKKLMRGRVPDPILDRTDKTLFDEAIEAGIDYELLDDLLKGDELIPGVDYRGLREKLARRDLELVEYMWAKDLAALHVFVREAGQA